MRSLFFPFFFLLISGNFKFHEIGYCLNSIFLMLFQLPCHTHSQWIFSLRLELQWPGLWLRAVGWTYFHCSLHLCWHSHLIHCGYLQPQKHAGAVRHILVLDDWIDWICWRVLAAGPAAVWFRSWVSLRGLQTGISFLIMALSQAIILIQ